MDTTEQLAAQYSGHELLRAYLMVAWDLSRDDAEDLLYRVDAELDILAEEMLDEELESYC